MTQTQRLPVRTLTEPFTRKAYPSFLMLCFEGSAVDIGKLHLKKTKKKFFVMALSNPRRQLDELFREDPDKRLLVLNVIHIKGLPLDPIIKLGIEAFQSFPDATDHMICSMGKKYRDNIMWLALHGHGLPRQQAA